MMVDMTPVDPRPDWDSWALMVADTIALRADCTRRKVGCVILSSDHRILSAGYNGAPSGTPGCLSSGACPRGRADYQQVAGLGDYDRPGSPSFCIAMHAEENALLFAHTDVRGATAYVNHEPCPRCRRALAAAGVGRVVHPHGSFESVAALMDFGEEQQ